MKRSDPPNGLHRAITQKTIIFTSTAVGTQFLLYGHELAHSHTRGINKRLIHVASTPNQSAVHSLVMDSVSRGEFAYTCERFCGTLRVLCCTPVGPSEQK
jgi:hypothetical protein